MKKRGDSPRIRIYAGKICPLAAITFGPGQRQVLIIISTPMLASNYMLNVKSKRRNFWDKRQYSQQLAARWRTNRIVSASVRREYHQFLEYSSFSSIAARPSSACEAGGAGRHLHDDYGE
jgi:hypothetical protein